MTQPLTPRVFVSAVSSDLRSARKVVNEALTRIECLPIEESVFGTEYGAIREMIARKIESCQAVIHVVGRDFGGEPDPRTLPAGQPRRSWTQIEYDLAKEQKQKLYLLVCGDAFPFDSPAVPEPADKSTAQLAHRQAVLTNSDLWHTVRCADELRQAVERMKIPLDEVRAELTTVGKKVERAQQETVRQLTDPAALAETIRKQIHATAETKIKALPDEKGVWRKEEEIKKERDLALGRVDDLIKLIQEGLKEGASPVFQRATEILQKEGTDEALGYLESSRPSTLKLARRHAEQAKAVQARADAEKDQRNKTLQALVLEAELLEFKLQWQPALELREQVAELAPDWFEARNSLGKLHCTLAHFREAEPHLRAATKLAGNPDQESSSLSDLALLLQSTSHLAEAELLIRRALAIDWQSYGAEHPNVALKLNNLAGLLQETNRVAEAEPLMRRALAIDEQSYGAEHPLVALKLNNLAGFLLQATNRLAESESLMRRALAIDEQSSGPEHPNVARDLNNLAALLQATNRLAGAEPLMRRALAIDEQSFGAEHPNIATDLNNLALLLQTTNRPAEAEPLMRRALAIDEQSYGAEHPDVAIPLNNLAKLLKSTNRLAEAEPLMRRTLAIVVNFKCRTGNEHPSYERRRDRYADLLQTMKLSDGEIAHRVKEVTASVGSLKPIVPEVERLLGPAQPVAEVLAALDRHYKADGKPAVYFLSPKEPIAPHLDELLGKSEIDLPLDQPIAPQLNKLLGPARSTKEVFEELDRRYREQNKPPVWFLPLSEPIAPHLDELLGPPK